MFAYINNAQILGNITKDAEVRYTANGYAVLSFTVATNHSKKVDDGYEDYAVFHNITFLGNLAEKAAPYIKKGTMIYVQGMIKNDSWQDDEGNWKNKSEIITSDFRNVRIFGKDSKPIVGGSSKGEESATDGGKAKGGADSKGSDQQEDPFAEEMDDLPF